MNVQISEKLIEEVVSQVLAKLANNSDRLQVNNEVKSQGMTLKEIGPAKVGTDPKEVIIGIGAAFGKGLNYTIKRLPHADVLKEIMAGIEEEGCKPRVVRILRTSDVGFIANYAAKLSGSGIGIGIQSKGTTVITQKDLNPLTNLELFPLAPIITLEKYRAIGRNAAKYAKGENPQPVPVEIDKTVLPIYQPIAVLLHNIETGYVIDRAEPVEVEVRFE